MEFGTGAIKDVVDSHDFIYEDVCGAGEPVDWSKPFNIEHKLSTLLKVESQNGSDACVGNAYAYYAEVLEMLENNKYTDLSARDIFSRIALKYGAYLRDGAKMITKRGVCEERLATSYENGKPPSKKFMREIPQGTDDNARIYISKSYAKIQGNNNIDKMAEIIRDNNGCVSGVRGSSQGWTTAKPRPPKDGEKKWGHALFFTSYKQVADRKYIGFINSWGTKWGNAGRGWLSEEYFGKYWLYSAWALIDKINNKDMLKLKREKGREEVFAVINGRNYYIGSMAFSDMLADKMVRWEDVEEVDEVIYLQGIIK